MGKQCSAEYVLGAMRDCLPPGVPLSFQINSARWLTKRRAQAEVTMFDGQPAVLVVWSWSRDGACAHTWSDMPGGAACFERGRWARVADPDEPEQAELFGTVLMEDAT